jgi:hypothetical protein
VANAKPRVHEIASELGVDSKVASCIADVIKQIEFPKAVNGGTIKVSYPFELKPSQETRRQNEIKEWLR